MKNFKEIPTFKFLFIPLLVEQLFQLLLGNMDVLMLSQYSDNSVAAVGLANQILVVTTMIYGFINIGTAIQLTQLSTIDQQERSAKVVSQAFYLNVIFTIVMTSALVIFHGRLLQMIQVPESLMGEASTYLKVVTYGLVFHSIMGLLGSIFRSYSMVKFVMFVSIFINIINIIFNYIVLFTPISIFGEGVFGIAVTTNLSRMIGMIILCLYFVKHKQLLFGFIDWLKIDVKAMKKILVLGIPSAGEHVSYNLSQVIITGFIASLGAATVTAKIYTQTITSVVFACSMAISQASQIITGKLIGTKMHDVAYNFSVRLLVKSVAITTTLTAIIALLSSTVISFFTSNEEIAHLTILLVFFSILLEPARTANVILVSNLNVAGDVRYPVFISIVVVWGFVIPMSFIVGVWLGYGLVGIWIVFILDEWIRALFLFLRWKKRRWKSVNILVD
ncbi:MATE family efflux transporter [Psychrobacillus soli]|uniref:MATE family efflux transporter n=1 Tax=Psychrobacillus soli TaxID=1543965 RepID=A0A544SK13_9BACI|nr:MATE family efflux transporter [Psychrobacillus soli]TQR05522.1 MATE family efflux transporter [Psychrobacillus soli]